VSDNTDHKRQPTFDWLLWLKWVLAGTLGWVAGVLLPGDIPFAIGVTLGIAQWIVLRPLFAQAGWWILASALGWAVGHVLVTIALPAQNLFLEGALLGATLGIAQWLVLRRWVYRAGWWIVISVVGWAAGPIVGPSLVGAVAGAATGVALELLVRYARPQEPESERAGE
jgi:hypothetical protein